MVEVIAAECIKAKPNVDVVSETNPQLPSVETCTLPSMYRLSSPLPSTSRMGLSHGPVVTTLVSLNKGNFDRTAFDVYIGGKVEIGKVLLEESKWHNPWENAVGFSSEEKLARYHSKIMHSPHLLNDLNELTGKTLGHFYEGLPEVHSHGSVLIRLIQKKAAGQCVVPPSLLCEKIQGRHIFFEPFSCWANTTASVMKFDNHHFMSTEQLHAYLMLVDNGHFDLACTLAQVADLGHLCEAVKTLTGNIQWEQNQIVFNMVRALDYKYTQDPYFRNMCILKARDTGVSSNRSAHIFVDCSGGNVPLFWGCGKTVREIHADQSLLELPGLNVMGWCLTFVNNYHELCEALPPNNPDLYSPFTLTLHRLEEDLKVVEQQTKYQRGLFFLDPLYFGLSVLLTGLRPYHEKLQSGQAWLEPNTAYCLNPPPSPPPPPPSSPVPTAPLLFPADSTTGNTNSLSLDHHVQIRIHDELEEKTQDEVEREAEEKEPEPEGCTENQASTSNPDIRILVEEDLREPTAAPAPAGIRLHCNKKMYQCLANFFVDAKTYYTFIHGILVWFISILHTLFSLLFFLFCFFWS